VTSVESEDAASGQDGVGSPDGSADRRDVALGRVVLLRFVVLVGVPVVALALALLARSPGGAVAARGAAAVVLAAMTLLTIASVGVGFALATALMVAATILAVSAAAGS
jgi:hypothetical protein